MPPGPANETGHRPFISVIVPVRNEARHIAGTLGQLLEQDYDQGSFEVLVADGRSTDSTPEVVRDFQAKYGNLYLLDNPGRLSSAGRNRAIEAARGDIIVVVDGHCDLRNPRYLQELVDAFAGSGADALGRPQPLDISGATPLQRAIALARSSWLGHHPSSHVHSTQEQFVPPDSVAVAYRRKVFATVGLFDETFDACEDVEFNHRLSRAGFSCFFAPKTRVFYHPRATLPELFRQMVRYGRGRVRLFRKHRETFSPACVAPAALVAGAISGSLLAMLLPLLMWPWAAVLLCYLAVVLGVSARLALKARDSRLFMFLPAVFAAMHAGAGAGVLAEAIAGWRGRRSVPDFGSLMPAEPRPSAPPPQTIVPPLVNALTFDVEDYYHVSGFEHVIERGQWDTFESRVVANSHRILDVLDRTSTRATFFVLGWVADRHPQVVRTIHAAGHEIGCHSYWHRLIYRQTPEEFRADLCRSRDILQELIGGPVTMYRAPSFSLTRDCLWALDILIEEGFSVDSSIFPTWHDRYGIAGISPRPHRLRRPAGELWEFPLPIRRVLGYPLPVGGGGYFRLYPYRITRRLLRAINAAGRPFVTYLHPWEFDPGQPRVAAGPWRAFRHYVNLGRTASRLEAMLRDFRLGTMTEALAHCSSVSRRPEPTFARAG
jgi:succinoglycan biosynthesis protein ExoA